MKNFTDLTGRVAVVIGGTSGLGKAIAIGMAQAGADVAPSGRRQELVNQTCEEILNLGRRSAAHTSDVHDRSTLDALCANVVSDLGHVDILVNAAGITSRKPTAGLDEAEWNRILDVNLTGTMRACQAFFPQLRETGHGRIINIGSLSSFVAFYEVAAYGASKAGVVALTRQLGCEWAPHGVNVNALIPGVFPTDLNSHLLYGTARGRELLMRTPMRRFGKPPELVGAAVFLASDAAGFITGQTIAVDGGFLASGVNS